MHSNPSEVLLHCLITKFFPSTQWTTNCMADYNGHSIKVGVLRNEDISMIMQNVKGNISQEKNKRRYSNKRGYSMK